MRSILGERDRKGLLVGGERSGERVRERVCARLEGSEGVSRVRRVGAEGVCVLALARG